MNIRVNVRSGRSALRWAQYILAAGGVAALAYCAFVLAGAHLYQKRQAQVFDHALQQPQSQPGSRSAPAIPARQASVREGTVLGRIQIPRIGLRVMIVEGDDDGELRHAAGHIPGTPLPGQAGNVAIAGHRDTFFRPLRNIRRNDSIRLITLQGNYEYRVTSTRIVGPDDVQVLDPTRQDTLTLVTCYPFEFVGSAPKRFIVRATRSAV